MGTTAPTELGEWQTPAEYNGEAVLSACNLICPSRPTCRGKGRHFHLYGQKRDLYALEELSGLRLSVVVLVVVEAEHWGDHHVVELAFR